jgi:hypothetical protein
MPTDRKYEPIKEGRGWYFVEYHPPVSDFKFADLHLTITIENPQEVDIVNAMEKELNDWLRRYPVPVFVSTFDNKGDLYHISKTKECNHLTGFFDQDGKICLYWRMVKDEEIPDIALNKEYVDELYSNFTFKTYAELDAERQKRRQQIERGFILFLFLPFVVTVIYESFVYFNKLLSLLAFFYILYKAVQKALKFAGMWPKSKREKEKEREENLKDHYYYHCQMNPKGFERLKLENFEKMGRDEIRKEVESLKNTQGT